MTMFHIDPRVHNPITPELKALYRRFNIIADTMSQHVTITGIRKVEYYSQFNCKMETIDELNSNFDDFVRGLWVDVSGRLVNGTPIYENNGVKYSESSQLPDTITMCKSCGKIHDRSHSVCPHCSGIANCDTHSQPNGGWQSAKTSADESDAPLFGFEIEMEFPEGTTPENEIRRAIRETGIAIPGVIERDGSLRNGREYVTHPMSWNYLWDNREDHIKLISKLIEFGASDRATTNNQNAGIHIHVNHPGINHVIPECRGWMESTYPLRLAISMRDKDRFDNYSGGRSGQSVYNYIGQRHHNTWECRGFSFKVLKTHPDALPHLAAYAQVMTNMLSNVADFNARKAGSLCDLLRHFDYTESADWFADKFGSIVTDPMYDEFRIQCEREYKEAVKKWGLNLMCREVVRREDWIDNDDGTSMNSIICDGTVNVPCATIKYDNGSDFIIFYYPIASGGYSSQSVKIINIRPAHMTDADLAMMPPRTFEEFYAIRKAARTASVENPLWDPSVNDVVTIEQEMAVV